MKRFFLMHGLLLLVTAMTGLCGCSDDVEGEFPDLVPGISDITTGKIRLDYTKLDDMEHPRLLATLADFETIKNRLAVSSELKIFHDQVIKQAESILSMPDLKYILTGQRLLSVSNQALFRIFNCAYLYRITGEQRFLEKAERDINTVCRFPGWNPDHYLDVAEMAAAVAIGYDWLYDALQEDTRKSVHTALERYVFDTSDKNTDKFVDRTNNWNQVCNCGLVLSALAMYEDDPERCRKIISRSVEANRNAVAQYGPDGNYPEGYGYWDYGTSFQVCLLSALEKVFGTDAGLSDIGGFMKTPYYMLYMVGPCGIFNYSDNNSGGCGNHLAMWWFAHKSGDYALLFQELSQLREGYYSKSEGYGVCWVRMLPMILPIVADMELSTVSAPAEKLWFGNGTTPVALIRTGWKDVANDRYVGIKGGKARTSHGHMDAGSFVYDAMGCRWAMDLGRDDYTIVEANMSGLWSYVQTSNRWTLLRCKNTYHNTLSLDNELHQVSGNCTITASWDTDHRRGVQLNTAPLYGDMVIAAMRSIVLEDERDLIVEDNLTMGEEDRTVRWHMVTPANPIQLSNKCWQLNQAGQTLYLVVESELPFTLKTWETVPKRDWEASNSGTVVVGFESSVKARTKASWSVRLTSNKP